MYHPDNLEEYYQHKNQIFDKASYINDLINAKNKVKETLKVGVAINRLSYPYFDEPENNGKMLQNRFKNKTENQQETAKIFQYLDSDIFEDFYKSLPMKDYCKQLAERQNISKTDLSKTNWFRNAVLQSIKKG